MNIVLSASCTQPHRFKPKGTANQIVICLRNYIFIVQGPNPGTRLLLHLNTRTKPKIPEYTQTVHNSTEKMNTVYHLKASIHYQALP